MLREVENLVAEAVEVNVPFMNPITQVLFCHNYVHLAKPSLPSAAIVHSHTRPASTLKQSSTTQVHMKSSSRKTSALQDMCQSGVFFIP
jgi:hypothetical protein